MMRLGFASLCLLAVLSAPARASAQNAWVVDWLREYAAGGESRAAVLERLPKIASPLVLRNDLDDLLETWLSEGGPPDIRRRQIAAFALEVAHVRAGSGPPAVELAEWGCRQIRRVRQPGEFERQWHLAAFALYSGVVDPDAIESHAGHMRLQFRDEPRLLFQRAVAEELRAAPFFENGRASAGDVAKRYEEAARRYREAAAQDEVAAEASARLGHTLIELHRYEEALEALDAVDQRTSDEYVRYLVHLFRGQALERLDRNDEALREYGLALAVRPRAQSASMAQAALMFKADQRGIADQIVAELLGRASQPRDPWWNYWPADYRFAEDLMARMREALE